MKLITRRATVLFFLALLFSWGLFTFMVKYFNNAPEWVQHPSNRHLYKNGKLVSTGTIYDREGRILLQMEGETISFNKEKTVRTAVMHAVGDLYGNIATGAQVAFGEYLSGWNIINGAYSFRGKRSSFSDLTLTLDADLCVTAYKELKNYRGTVGVFNYRTGELLCMVSTPTFDPEDPPDVGANPQKYEGVYLNRLLSATYTPGSVFKLVTTAAALDNFNGDKLSANPVYGQPAHEHPGGDNPGSKDSNQGKANLYHCSGKLQVGKEMVTCPSVHGEVTLEQALACSCNVTFAQITLELGAETLQKYANLAGFNVGLEVDGIKTAAGKVNVQGVEGADLAWAGIGQYTNTANPLNFMAYMGAIANDGLRITPRLLARRGILSYLSTCPGERKRILAAETARKLGEMMRNNTISVYGEGNFSGLELCAKSGTAEVGGGEKPHSWFAGFLKRKDYPLAFVVIVENGGSGSGVAASIAAKVLQAATK
ncbi:MAG: penicillin-binding transpeptidase domain-containing protein [Dethiobacteria bacterium]|jgi:peptidoglycan glycosyltransferase